ncbi:VirB3 family type IV secretion system protein [Chromobacterium piscinae]|uniref:VirB3 family type IV secretion system protein n=1 Tax=Chromobacterium piscinae TaxID=686831 RepID=UPI001E28F093|nr:VirB3 family type IV secretion system protein [Chromobacterium piscinae]MCD5327924.1 VirB3 family type IV secretion system protein [Chromobacterium piscinae]
MDGLPIRPIHRSLLRRQTIMGGERELILSSFLIGVGVGFACTGGFGPLYGIPVGLAITVALLFVVKRMGETDPQLSRILQRHFRYRAYYPARGRIRSIIPQVRDFR